MKNLITPINVNIIRHNMSCEKLYQQVQKWRQGNQKQRGDEGRREKGLKN